jgi:hypothetical protein
MVHANRRGFAEARKHRFDAGAKASEVVRADAPGGDDEIGFDDAAMNADRRAACCRAELDQVLRRVTVMIDELGSAQRSIRQLELIELTWTVSAGRDRDRQLARGHTLANRTDERVARLAPRGITNDQGNPTSDELDVRERAIDQLCEHRWFRLHGGLDDVDFAVANIDDKRPRSIGQVDPHQDPKTGRFGQITCTT